MEKIKNFFKAVGAWIKSHVLISAIIGGVLVVGITLAIVLPITLSSANKKGSSEQSSQQPTSSEPAPAHVHSYDDFGFCTCGVHEEPENVVAVRNGTFSEPLLLAGGTKQIFKIFSPHNFKVTQAYGFDSENIEYEWFDGKEVQKKTMNTYGTDTVEVPATGTFVYFRATVTGEPTEYKYSFIKTAHATGTEHTFDDHAHCACGWTDTTTSVHTYLARTIDTEPSKINLTKDETYSFKVKLYKGHTYNFTKFAAYPPKADVEYYDPALGQWVLTQFDNNGYDNFNDSHAKFVAPITTDYFIHIKATQTITEQSGKVVTDEHIYTPYGLDVEDRSYLGTALTVGQNSDTFSMAAGEEKFFKWTFTSSQVAEKTGWQFSGDHIGVNANSVHVEGVWFEKDCYSNGPYYQKTIQETGGYGFHNNPPEAGTYYVRIVNGANTTVSDIKVKPNTMPAL